MNIEGNWAVRYARKQDDVFVNEDGEPDEVGDVVLEGGNISGGDPWGGKYVGSYNLDGNAISATVVVTSDEVDHPFIFPNVESPFTLELRGEFNSPNYFSLTGLISGQAEHEIVLNCKRIRD